MLVSNCTNLTRGFRVFLAAISLILMLSSSQSAYSQNGQLKICLIRHEIDSGDVQMMKNRISKIQNAISSVNQKIAFSGNNGSGCRDIGEYTIVSAKLTDTGFRIIADFVPHAEIVDKIRAGIAINPEKIEVRRQEGPANRIVGDKDYAIIRTIVYDHAKKANAVSAAEIKSFCNSLSSNGKAPAYNIGRIILC